MDLFSQPSTSAADPQFVENTQVSTPEIRTHSTLNLYCAGARRIEKHSRHQYLE